MNEFDLPVRDLATIRKIEDKNLRALTLAARYWKLSAMTDKDGQMDFARELHTYALFSLANLAVICRLSPSTVGRDLKKNSPGGRLAPETLTMLVQLRKQVLDKKAPYPSLMREAVEHGTSLSNVCRLIGVNNSAYYLKIGK